MAEFYVSGANNNIKRLGSVDYQWLGARGLRDGSLVDQDMLTVLAMEGRVFTATGGTAQTQLTFLAAAANRPDFWVRVPSGTTLIPLSINVSLGAMAGTVNLIDFRYCQNDIGNGTSSAASVGPLSLRTDAPIASTCTPRQLATADTTAETNPVSFFRKTFPVASAAGDGTADGADWFAKMDIPPILVGPASLEVFVSATTTQATGFVVVKWAEVPSTMFS